jgi:hypothetical protein
MNSREDTVGHMFPRLGFSFHTAFRQARIGVARFCLLLNLQQILGALIFILVNSLFYGSGR